MLRVVIVIVAILLYVVPATVTTVLYRRSRAFRLPEARVRLDKTWVTWSWYIAVLRTSNYSAEGRDLVVRMRTWGIVWQVALFVDWVIMMNLFL
jgi:hypothetical protein